MNMYNPYEWAGRYSVGLADHHHAEMFNLAGSMWFVFTSMQWQGVYMWICITLLYKYRLLNSLPENNQLEMLQSETLMTHPLLSSSAVEIIQFWTIWFTGIRTLRGQRKCDCDRYLFPIKQRAHVFHINACQQQMSPESIPLTVKCVGLIWPCRYQQSIFVLLYDHH